MNRNDQPKERNQQKKRHRCWWALCGTFSPMWNEHHWLMMFINDTCFPAYCRQMMCNIYWFGRIHLRRGTRAYIYTWRKSKRVFVQEKKTKKTRQTQKHNTTAKIRPSWMNGQQLIVGLHKLNNEKRKSDINRRLFEINTSD